MTDEIQTVSRASIENERDAEVWRLLEIVAVDEFSDMIPAIFLDVRDKAVELASNDAGEASESHVRATTAYLRAARALVQVAIPLDEVPDYMNVAKRLEEEGVDVVNAAEAVGGVAATLGDEATPIRCLQAVRATLSAVGRL